MDDDIMQRVAAGDRRAFERLVTAHQGRLLQFAAGMLGERESAEDAVQEAFIRLWQARARYRANGSLVAYLYQVVRNICLDYLRAARSHPETQITDEALETLMQRPGPIVQDQELADAIRQAISELPEPQRLVFVLSQYEGLSYQEIAEVLGCPMGTVASRKHLAMETMRGRLRPWKEEE